MDKTHESSVSLWRAAEAVGSIPLVAHGQLSHVGLRALSTDTSGMDCSVARCVQRVIWLQILFQMLPPHFSRHITPAS